MLKFEEKKKIFEIMFYFNCWACYESFEHHDELI